MAANYSATIQLIVEGQQRLDKLQSQVTALNKQIKELARLDIGGIFEDPLMGGAVAKLRAARNEQVASLKQTGQQQDLVNRKLESQLLNQIRLNSAVDLYKRRLNEVSRTAAPEQTQFKDRLQELEQAFQFFKGKSSVQGVQAVATELGRIVEYSREVTRLELGRVKSSQQIKDYVAQIEKLKLAGLDTVKAEATLEKFTVNAGTNKFKLAEKYKIVLDSRLKSLTEELRLQKEIAAAEARKGRNIGGRAGGAISSAIIGGGFPLLFGQGPAAAAGGALGGLAGGLLGGGFGFALSIAGTAIGDLITQSETLNTSLAGLNSSLTTTGTTSTTTAQDIKQLAKNLQITNDEAIQLVGTFSQFGSAQTREALASLFGGVGGAATFEAIARAGIDEKETLNSVFELRKIIGNEAATQLALQLNTVGATQTQATLLKLVVERSIQNSVATAKNVQYTDNLLSTWENIIAGVAGALSLAIRFIQKMREGSLLRLPFLDQVANILGGVKARSGKQIAEERGGEVEKRLRAEIDAARKALQQETSVLGTQSALQQSMGGTRKEDRTPQLKEELQALKQIGEAENNIRDLKFEGKNIEALAAEKTRAIADIERDRNKALLTANNASEKALYIQIANQRIANLNLETADKERDIRQQIFEEELRAQEAVRNAVKPFTDLRKEQELQLQFSKTYSRLVNEGMLPAEAERIANFEKLVKQQRDAVTEQIKITELAILEAKARGASTVELEKALKIYKDQQKAVADAAGKGPGKGKTPRERLEEAATEAKGRLNELIDPVNMIKTAAKGIGDAFAQSFEGIVSGTMTAQEALANFFKSIGDMFVQMAAKIIAEMITMYAIKTLLGLFGNGGTFGQGTTPNTTTTTTVTGYAANGAMFSNGIAKFAAGGAFTNSIVNTPTLFKFADGGTPNLGVMGEAGPEAIMPLRRNSAGRLGVETSGLRDAMGAAPGSAGGSPVLNMNFETSTINGVEYVSRNQLEAAMAETRRQASRDGAKRGMTMTLDRIQQSPQTRSRLGLR